MLRCRGPDERVYATVGAVVATCMCGVDFVRVHDVAAVRQALAVADAIKSHRRRA